MEKLNFHLAPSILSADFSKLGAQITELEALGCRGLHIDVMDGHFVPQISFGAPVIRSIRKLSGMCFDVHMMVTDPDSLILPMKEAGADLLTVHAEACVHLDRTLSEIRRAGMLAGVALNPATPLNVLDYVLDRVDMVLIMTVNPGFGGQSYLPSMTAKITELREKLNAAGYGDMPIEVDGGIGADTLEQAKSAGADIFVAGSAVFAGDLPENIRMFRNKLGVL